MYFLYSRFGQINANARLEGRGWKKKPRQLSIKPLEGKTMEDPNSGSFLEVAGDC